jgi:hypothetical protein
MARQKWTASGFQPLSLYEVSPHVAPRASGGGSDPRSSALGLTVGLLGVVLVILSLTTLTWSQSGLVTKDFAFFHTFSGEPGPWLIKAYFGWLAVTGFIVTTVVAVIAKLGTPIGGLMRALGAALGLTLAVLTFVAPTSSNSIHDIFAYSRAGFWAAIVGFVCIGIGALI